MDFFGIGKALHHCVANYIKTSAQTGRTTALLASLEDGDRVVFHSEKEAQRVKDLALHRGVTILTEVLDPKHVHIHDLGTSQKRTILDHQLIERFYQHKLECCSRDLRMLEREWSGNGAPHLETKRTAEVLNKLI